MSCGRDKYPPESSTSPREGGQTSQRTRTSSYLMGVGRLKLLLSYSWLHLFHFGDHHHVPQSALVDEFLLMDISSLCGGPSTGLECLVHGGDVSFYLLNMNKRGDSLSPFLSLLSLVEEATKCTNWCRVLGRVHSAIAIGYSVPMV